MEPRARPLRVEAIGSARRSPVPLRAQRAKQAIVLGACGLLVATTYSDSILSVLTRVPSVYSFSFLFLLFALLLPPKLMALAIPLTLGVLVGAGYVNEAKVSAVSLPITFDDLMVSLRDPTVVLNALGVGVTTPALLAAVIAGVSITVVLLVYRRRASRISWTVSQAVCVAVLVFAALVCFGRYGRFVHDDLTGTEAELWKDFWLPGSQVSLSRRLGVLEYVGFSFVAGDDGSGTTPERGAGATAEEIRRAAADFLGDPAARPARALSPNVVFFHAESSFDPNLVFNLSSRVDLPLWSPMQESKIVAPLRVNVLGGGSWVTEFEVLTGVDSRIFGYQGFYTHYYIAPRVKDSFARYLRRKGYRTAAFYPVEGTFYNVAVAFRAYGFDEFYDGAVLRLPTDWAQFVDRDIVRSVIERGAFDGGDPFFLFIGTAENHGPHRCRHFADASRFMTTFSGAASFEENCQLNEYLRRARSTADAFVMVLNELKRVERRTGRPFVLLAYGDHQPWSFTGGRYSIAGGTAIERGATVLTTGDGYQTFLHLIASADTNFKRRLASAPSPALLPTLASAFVAESYDDLYLPINFLAFANCGSELKASGCARYADIAGAWRGFLLRPARQGREAGSSPVAP